MYRRLMVDDVKSYILLILLPLIHCSLCGCSNVSQSAKSKEVSKSVKNKSDRAEAIKFVSQLTLGMQEEDALAFLYKHGLFDNVPGIGDSFSWSHVYMLADGCNLVLQITPEPFVSGSMRINGRLRAAYIQEGSGKLISVALNKASAKTGNE